MRPHHLRRLALLALAAALSAGEATAPPPARDPFELEPGGTPAPTGAAAADLQIPVPILPPADLDAVITGLLRLADDGTAVARMRIANAAEGRRVLRVRSGQVLHLALRPRQADGGRPGADAGRLATLTATCGAADDQGLHLRLEDGRILIVPFATPPAGGAATTRGGSRR